ncbi:monovalent cation/H+ antiporter complex subunit F [Histidinibacterium lentulum]|uniref:pH regulation protein F n=1 Tax=Histidinibacterium lentulum TaxID=2480588 RepID=A0A3N2R8G3_9RHOB|nr:monovalent cation/H+ antiporter complex subunit F [Histidinibacterium lentulum]ROU03725.1 pH regulation protein F [Histidinibacterium lentulum]
MTSGEFLSLSVELTLGMVIISVALAFFRLFRGPSLPDRVVALDMMTVAIVAFCGAAAVLYEQVAFLDVGLVLALVGFLATAALARYAERRRLRKEEEKEQP